jgi:hypothetical protein
MQHITTEPKPKPMNFTDQTTEPRRPRPCSRSEKKLRGRKNLEGGRVRCQGLCQTLLLNLMLVQGWFPSYSWGRWYACQCYMARRDRADSKQFVWYESQVLTHWDGHLFSVFAFPGYTCPGGHWRPVAMFPRFP